MRRYIRYIICFPLTFVKFAILKIFHWKNFYFYPLELFAVNSEMVVEKGSMVKLGKFVRAQSGVRLRARKNAKLIIGDNTAFNTGCIVTCHYDVRLGVGIEFGQNVLIYDHDHDFRAKGGIKSKKYKYGSVEIGDNCWIGANTVILRNTKIGNNCVVGAGSVLHGVYPDNCVIVQKRKTEIISV